tara:strand:- start:34 stop:321 length:288 start_codon:yes stop_codon:yes gene_type:complete
MQLLNSKGRFFTAEWKGLGAIDENGNLVIGEMIKANFKVVDIIDVSSDRICAAVYIPRTGDTLCLNFMTNAEGDCTYIASDKSKFEMSGKQAFKF